VIRGCGSLLLLWLRGIDVEGEAARLPTRRDGRSVAWVRDQTVSGESRLRYGTESALRVAGFLWTAFHMQCFWNLVEGANVAVRGPRSQIVCTVN